MKMLFGVSCKWLCDRWTEMLILRPACRISVILETESDEKHREAGNERHDDERTWEGRTSQEWLTDWPPVERRLHPGLKGLQGALPELHSVRFYSLCCFSDVIPWKSRGWSERWSSCLLRFSKGCFLKHVVSCHCFGAFVVEIEKRWWILFLAATLIILQCLCEFRITQVFTLQTGRQRPRQV